MSSHSPRVYLNTPDMADPIGVTLGTDGKYRLLVSSNGAATSPSSPAVDSFGRSRASTPTSIFDSKQVFDNQPLLFAEYTASGGSTSYQQSRASTSLLSGTSNGGRALRQTKRYFNYQPGKSQLIFTTYNFHGEQANVSKRVGYFDDSDGIFLELNESLAGDPVYSIVIRSSVTGATTPISVPQSGWNIDPLDGTGPSGKALNPNAACILIIDFEWLGVGQVRVGFDFGGETIYAHRFSHSNEVTSVYMRTPNLPVRWEIVNTAAASGTPNMEAICCSVQSEGGLNPLSVQRTISRGAVGANVDTTLRSMLAIRLKPSYNRATVLPLLASAITTGSSNYLGQLILNPTFGTTPTWTNVLNSPIQYSTTASTLANGTVMSEFYGISTSPGKSGSASLTNTADLTSVLTLASDYAGTQDILALGVRTLSGSDTAAMFAIMDWLELL